MPPQAEPTELSAGKHSPVDPVRTSDPEESLLVRGHGVCGQDHGSSSVDWHSDAEHLRKAPGEFEKALTAYPYKNPIPDHERPPEYTSFPIGVDRRFSNTE